MEYLKITIEHTDKPDNKQARSGNNYYKYRLSKQAVKDNTVAELKRQKKKSRKQGRKQRAYKNRVPRSYKAYIASPHWTKRRNQYWQKVSRQCCVCGSCKYVQLHHGKYASETFGKEPDEWLFPMCQSCHQDFHDTYGVSGNMLKNTMKYIEDNFCIIEP